ncbi:MAG TPA: S41 family peptidase [Opitutaceae bacterium]|jgi:carboxyl-terminal processing protease
MRLAMLALATLVAAAGTAFAADPPAAPGASQEPQPFTEPSLLGDKPAYLAQPQAPYDPANDPDLKAGQAAFAAGDYSTAARDFDTVLQNFPNNYLALVGRAAVYVVTKDNARAEAEYKAALGAAGPGNRRIVLVAMSHFHAATRKYDQALADIDRCLAAEPNSAQLVDMRGQVHDEAGHEEKAYADFTEAIRLAPDDPDTYRYRGTFLAIRKRYVESLDDLSQAIVLDPSNAADFMQRALVLLKLNRNKESIGDLRSALKIDPADPETLNELAWLLATCPVAALRDGKAAIAYATQSCTLSHWKDGHIVDTLAAAYAETGDLRDAVKWQTVACALPETMASEQDEMERHLALYREGKPYHDPAPDLSATAWDTLRYETFETVWQTVDESYFDPTFGGLDWSAVREKYRLRLADLKSPAQLRQLLMQMLSELHKTHFAIVPREAAVFNPAERVRIGSSGVELASLGGLPAVQGVAAGSTGEASGLRAGDIIFSVDGRALRPVAEALSKAGLDAARIDAYLCGYVDSFLTGAVGSSVLLGVDGADTSRGQVRVEVGPSGGAWSDPVGYFPSRPIYTEFRRDGGDVAVIKFNVFVPQVMRGIRAFMRTVGPGSGLVIDLRGNSGGVTLMAAGICGLLVDKETSLGSVVMRDGTQNLEVYPSQHPFGGPVAVLVDSRSASSSEVLAAGIRDIGRARLFGEKTPGMALPSIFKVLPTGDLFQYAIGDFMTPRGRSLEGIGVEPDQAIAETREDVARGRDRVLEAAEAWIRTRLAGGGHPK